jgi:hypothetical protein
LPARSSEDEEKQMSSVHRVGLTIAGLATTVLIAAVFVVQGYVSAQQAAATASANAATPTPAPTATPTLEPRTIYIDPVPTPSVISITQTAPPAARQKPPVVHVVVPSTGGDDDGGHDD